MSAPRACEYVLVRVAPNPIRQEFVNVGVALFDAGGALVGVRVTNDWRRVRQLHPQFEEDDVRELAAELETRLQGADRAAFLALAEETFSQGLQLGPATTVYSADPAAELERLYRELAAPPAARAAERAAGPRAAIKRALERVFERERVAPWLRAATAGELGAGGDRYRFDFTYRNGGLHCLQPLPLGGDDAPVRELCFTVQRLQRLTPTLRATAIAGEAGGEDAASRFQQDLLTEAGVRLRRVGEAAAVAAEIRRDLGIS